MTGEWIRQRVDGTTLLFVHGVLSSGETAWQHDGGAYWPHLVRDEPGLSHIGVRVFSYQSSVFSGSYDLGDVVDALKEDIRLHGLLQAKRLVFVCHSMGGLVARKYIVERQSDLIDSQSSLGLFLVASPSLGSDYATWLAPLAAALGHAQADVLRFTQKNLWLSDLDRSFINLKESERITMRGKELIEDKFVILRRIWRKQLVEPFSGARYFGERFKVPGSDHFSIAKPGNSASIQHKLLVQFITDIEALEGAAREPGVAEVAPQTEQLSRLSQRLLVAQGTVELRRIRFEAAALTEAHPSAEADELLHRVETALRHHVPAFGTHERVPELATRGRSRALIIAAALTLFAALAYGLFSAAAGDDPSPGPPPDGFSFFRCDPVAWAEAAQEYIAETQLEVEWIDPDGDCLHTEYERNSSGTPPTSPTELIPIPGFEEQFSEGLLVPTPS